MPRKVRTILAKMGLQDHRVSPDKASAMANRYVAENMKRTSKPAPDFNEDRLCELIDDKAMLGEIFEEYLPVFKRIRLMRDPEEQLQALARFTPMILGKILFFGDPNEARQAAKDILDRVQGKPIERQMTMSVNVHSMTETEVDHELTQLINKFKPNAGRPEIPLDGSETITLKAHEEERGDLGGDESRKNGPEPRAEAVHGVEGQNSRVHSGK